ncbi:unnamed protein product [Linum tenue]|uniref:Uncharacterized protein n=1 Tax=Linum tenue TaxID=586396 RepID=A0AAV0N5Z4_9ROSI|nr:unnamed protein product [Linum tenue]
MAASTAAAPSLCWDTTPYLPTGQGRCRSSAAPECSDSHVERFISKRIPLIPRPETRSWSVTSTLFTIDSLTIIIITTIIMFDSFFLLPLHWLATIFI